MVVLLHLKQIVELEIELQKTSVTACVHEDFSTAASEEGREVEKEPE